MTLNIQLPDELNRYVQQQVTKLGYKDASEYFAAVLEAEQHRQLNQEIDQMLLEASDGPFLEWSDQDIEQTRNTGREIIERRRSR